MPQIIELQNGVAVSTNDFVWDGQTLVEQRDNTGTNTVRRFFVQGEQISGTNYYFTKDHLGSIREMTDATGTIHARYDYDSYGRLTKISGDMDSDFAYTGFYRHGPSGLYLTLYRAYDPELGRWLNQDPAQNFGGLNLYGYVANNPINQVDLFGLSAADVSRLTALSQQFTAALTQNGRRLNNGALNNFTSSLQSLLGSPSPYLGCGQQALALANFLNGTGTDDQWQFSYMEIYDSGYHQLVIAQSSNPNDPILFLDPWNDAFGSTPPALYFLGLITPAINSTGNNNSTLPSIANPARGLALVP